MIARVSLLDDLRFNVFHVLPYFAQGLFRKRPFWVGLVARMHPDPSGVRFGGRLRQKYRGRCVRLHMLTTPTVLVWDAELMRRVLDYSPSVYAEPDSKRRGMSHFQPESLTISRGAAWQSRRRFNEQVLQSGGLHPFASRFLEVVREEVRADRNRSRGAWTWPDAERLFNVLALRIIFGDRAREDWKLVKTLDSLMRQANRLVLLRRNRAFDVLSERIANYLADPEPHTLAASCRETPADEQTRVANQIPHWMFALKDTLAMNAVMALALVSSQDACSERVRAELPAGDSSANSLDQCRYLEGCVQEAMRLWPTTPMLVRTTLAADLLRDAVIPQGVQVLIWNSFNHRDTASEPDADHFRPERWKEGGADYRYNHFSHGAQQCAGKSLALFLAKAVVAEWVRHESFALKCPNLPPSGRLPHAFDVFRARFERKPGR